MSRELVFIHGRAQEHKNSAALKSEWLDAFGDGLRKSGLKLPIEEPAVHFPFYGDALYDLVDGKPDSEAAHVIIRGGLGESPEDKFLREVLNEVIQKSGITDGEVRKALGDDVLRRGVLNWEWVQGILQIIDRRVPFGSGAGIALATYDVWCYLTDDQLRKRIDAEVRAAIKPGKETVIVSHSLGTVVAYNILRSSQQQDRWQVPLFVTVGSPLAVTAIKRKVRELAVPLRCPECASAWFNAMDDRDVVALYPLDAENFPINPANPGITNKTDVRNKTSNRHGIAGYLDDKEVASQIYQALVAP